MIEEIGEQFLDGDHGSGSFDFLQDDLEPWGKNYFGVFELISLIKLLLALKRIPQSVIENAAFEMVETHRHEIQPGRDSWVPWCAWVPGCDLEIFLSIGSLPFCLVYGS